MFVRGPSYTERQLREAVAVSRSRSETLQALGLRPAGGNFATLAKCLREWHIPILHFNPNGLRADAGRGRARPLEEVLVEHSTYGRGILKRRLYAAGLKEPRCELCGQGDEWRGRRMALVLDHINGDATDNRLENLRIVCPNCNATLETHCGRNKPRGRPARPCEACGGTFRPRYAEHRF